jgi:Domain of unknown function (DUF6894)
MATFYFHLATPVGHFHDDTGCDVPDLAAAHSRAIKAAKWMMMRSGLAEDELEWRGWSFEVTDDRRESRLKVLFQSCLVQARLGSMSLTT